MEERPTPHPLQPIADALRIDGAIRQVWGEPIHAHGRTIGPVAGIGYGFGGGGKPGDGRAMGPGGAGAGLGAGPVGYVEMTPEGTRFVRFFRPGPLLAAFGLGLLLGWMLRTK